jgi:hypothetical protein
MYSILAPEFVYTDISPDITENDIDVVSDLWVMDGREVYRGGRDPRYTHANVYWLYDQDLQRVGCSEHALDNPGDVRLLWFQEDEFGTLFQEDGWTTSGDLWSRLPKAPFERFLNEGWTTIDSFLEQCLHGPLRILTPEMIIQRPTVYTCVKCGKRSLRQSPFCTNVETPLDLPALEKVLFVDSDFILHTPPPDSEVFTRLRLRSGGDSQQASQAQEPVQEPAQAQEQEQVPQQSPPRQAEPQPEHSSPPQSHPRTPEPPSDAGEEQPAHA